MHCAADLRARPIGHVMREHCVFGLLSKIHYSVSCRLVLSDLEISAKQMSRGANDPYTMSIQLATAESCPPPEEVLIRTPGDLSALRARYAAHNGTKSLQGQPRYAELSTEANRLLDIVDSVRAGPMTPSRNLADDGSEWINREYNAAIKQIDPFVRERMARSHISWVSRIGL